MEKIVSMLAVIVCSLMFSSFSFAASGKCTVVGIDKNRLTMECNKKAGTFSVSDEIKIKSMKKNQKSKAEDRNRQ